MDIYPFQIWDLDMILYPTRGKPDLRSGLKLGEAEEILSVTWGAAFSSPRQYINKLNST